MRGIFQLKKKKYINLIFVMVQYICVDVGSPVSKVS